MVALKKVVITPFFGDLPPWFDKFTPPAGYRWILDRDLDKFKARVKRKLGIDYTGEPGSGKVWDLRCAFGVLYEEELRAAGADYWAHMDLDVVWGDVDHFLPDSLLSTLDVYSGHDKYVCGCFSVYRNSPEVNNLFKNFGLWQTKMQDAIPTGWVEQEYSRILEISGLRYKYDFQQGFPWDNDPSLKKENKRLYQYIDERWVEIMFFHFRHSKRWPL